VKGYNYSLTTMGESPALSCAGPSGSKTLTSTSTNTNLLAGKQATCKNYQVSGANVNGSVVSGTFTVSSAGTPGSPDGSLSEYTSITLPAINANDVVNLITSTQADYLPVATCTYVASDLNGSGGWKGSANPTVTPGACPP
jgi:hypothetical protein